MTKTTLEKDLEARAALDRKIAGHHLKATEKLVERLAQPDVKKLFEEVEALVPGLNPFGQEQAGNILSVLFHVPQAVASQVDILTQASAEPVETVDPALLAAQAKKLDDDL